MSATLPAGFEALEPFVARWANATAADRARLRGAASADEVQAFYACTRPLLEPALCRLDSTPLAEHDEAERRLMRLMLAFAHVSLAVEVQREDEARHTSLREHMPILCAPADV